MVEACESAIGDGGRGTKAAVLDSRRSKLIAAPTGPIRDIGVLVADEASMFATMWDQIGGEAEAGCGQAPLVSDHQKWAPGARLDDRPVVEIFHVLHACDSRPDHASARRLAVSPGQAAEPSGIGSLSACGVKERVAPPTPNTCSIIQGD